MLRERWLLKEYVRIVLSEEGDGGGGWGGYGDYVGGMGGGGGGYGMGGIVDNDDLYKTFIKPFTDVVGVAAGKTKEMSQRTVTLLKTVIEAIYQTIVPIYEDRYAKIFQEEKQHLDRIKSEYSKVYQATWDAFKDHDVLCAAFMYRPDLFLTTVLARSAPTAAAKLLSVLSGGMLDNALAGITGSGRKKKKSPKEFFADFFTQESVLREDGDNAQVSPLEKLISNKKVRQVLANSDVVKQMTKEGQAMVRKTLNDVYKQAFSALTAKSLEDMQKKLGQKIPGLEKLSQVPEQERQKAEQTLLKSVKEGLKAFYVKGLETHVREAVQAGTPQNHPFVRDYATTIAKIKAL